MSEICLDVCCPKCGKRNLSVGDSIKMSNGTRKRYRKCSCSERSITTREIPESAYQRLLRAAGG